MAYEAARTTLDVVPNDTSTLVHLAQVPSYAGNPDLAIEWISRAIGREVHVPDWFFLQLGLAFHAKGDCKRAVQELQKVPFVAHDKSSSLTACYVELDRLDDAKAEIAKLRESWPDLTVSSIGLWLPYKNQAFRDRVHAALIEAGLPE